MELWTIWAFQPESGGVGGTAAVFLRLSAELVITHIFFETSLEELISKLLIVKYLVLVPFRPLSILAE